jgi:hypothetical protein
VKIELLEFTRQALAQKLPRSEITAILLQAGWNRAEIAAALGAFAEVEFPLPVPRRQPYLSPREAFTYAVQFSALAVATFSLGALLFDLINRSFPDRLVPNVWGAATSIRWHISYLAVSAPLFLAFYARTTRAIQLDPVKRSSKLRRGLTYFALFIVAAFLVGDTIGLIYNTLGGELTARVLLKVLTVAVIAGGTCGFFISDVRNDEAEA